MSTGTPHLLVDTPDAASLVVGPLVIPGQTPCARCIALAREEQSEIWSGVDWQRNILQSAEVPVSVAHHIAGLIALELLRFIDSGDSEMIGSRVRCNYHSPLQGGRIIYARHPACGCSW
jgi:bacteriocin biosynthesis cyclodehydratase domain-containing protein